MWLGGRGVLVVFAVALVLAVYPAGVVANPWSEVDCAQFPQHADCRVQAGESEDAGLVPTPADQVECRDDTGDVVECHIEGQGWIGTDGCRYLLNGRDSPPDGVHERGGWYLRQCTDTPGGGVVWISDGEAPGPAMLARLAASRLQLPPPELRLNPPPSAPQLVMLPTWLWIAPPWWAPRSASVSVPGLTVTAVATPAEVRWETGDGAEVVCDAGTPYDAAVDPEQPSPDCGHTYTRTSSDAPGGVFILRATVGWDVTWSGGAGGDSLGRLFSTATAEVEVVESLSRNTRS